MSRTQPGRLPGGFQRTSARRGGRWGSKSGIWKAWRGPKGSRRKHRKFTLRLLGAATDRGRRLRPKAAEWPRTRGSVLRPAPCCRLIQRVLRALRAPGSWPPDAKPAQGSLSPAAGSSPVSDPVFLWASACGALGCVWVGDTEGSARRGGGSAGSLRDPPGSPAGPRTERSLRFVSDTSFDVFQNLPPQ